MIHTSYFDLTGHACIITGGLGQLGRQFTSVLHAHGANVIVLELAPSENQVRDFKVRYGERGCLLRADVTDKDSLARALNEVTGRFGIPTGLINNAALDSPPGASVEENGPFEDYPESSFDKIMEVNVKGTFLCCQTFGGAMAKAGRGSIVNISSTYGVGSPCQDIYEYRRKRGETFYKPVAYSVSKSAVLNLTRYLATYWGEAGVRVNTLTFGGVFNNQDEEFLSAYAKRVPVRRMANEDEYNGAVVYLMSDASSYMTGGNMIIDGGWTAW
jgi:NAD(P)-dependent dehydrogenase (short-subunit alcohol dehydrogenase family)